jgi:predicted ribonuclease YlaK
MKFYDTNALLELQEEVLAEDFAISSVTLEELESIKTNKNKTEETRYKARKIVHILDENRDKYQVVIHNDDSFEILMNSGIEVTNDSKICACAKYFSRDNDITFVTNDLCCRLIAEEIFGLKVEKAIANNDIYKGYKEVAMTEEEMAYFFSNMNNNIYQLKINEYLIINNIPKDNVYKWNGEQYVLVAPTSFKSMNFGNIKPLDTIQQCACDSIANNQITMLFGRAGSGKTLLPMAYANAMMDKGKYNNITFIYSYDTLNGAKDLGYEKGDHITKLLNYGAIGGILSSKYGDMYEVEKKIDSGEINIIPTAYIRGISLKKSIVIVTEAQNLDVYTLKTIIQRCENDCKLIIEGDMIEQKDTNVTQIGMKRFSEVFSGNDCVGIVKLKSNYRSKISELADNM